MPDPTGLLDVWLDGVRGLFAEGGAVMPPLVLSAAVLWYGLAQRIGILRRSVVTDAEARIRRAVVGERGSDAREEAARLAVQGLLDGLGRYRRVVQSLAFAAPLLGLLGTVSGMIETFDALGQQAMFRQSGGIAGGIGEALLTTQMGLCIAIPGTVVGRLLERREDLLRKEIDDRIALAVRDEEERWAA
jgi:biopolymer transport protein ExbB